MKTWKEFVTYLETLIDQIKETSGEEFDDKYPLEFEDGWKVQLALNSDNDRISSFTIYRWGCEILDCIVNYPVDQYMEIIYVHWTEDALEGAHRLLGVSNAVKDVSDTIDKEDSDIMLNDLFTWIHSMG